MFFHPLFFSHSTVLMGVTQVVIKFPIISLDAQDEKIERVSPTPSSHCHLFLTYTSFQRFQREIQSWKAIEHPNILPLHAVITKPDRGFVSPLCKHGNVRHYLKSHTLTDKLALVST